MTPLPTNPKVVVLLNPEGRVEKVATNVSIDLDVKVTRDREVYYKAALGQPFKTPTE